LGGQRREKGEIKKPIAGEIALDCLKNGGKKKRKVVKKMKAGSGLLKMGGGKKRERKRIKFFGPDNSIEKGRTKKTRKLPPTHARVHANQGNNRTESLKRRIKVKKHQKASHILWGGQRLQRGLAKNKRLLQKHRVGGETMLQNRKSKMGNEHQAAQRKLQSGQMKNCCNGKTRAEKREELNPRKSPRIEKFHSKGPDGRN